MPWMRLAIGVGGTGMLAGVAGMFVWIDDGSNYFGVAVALASAGFLTLVACVLTSVFGSSHGSQDDAFRRGREMGYDAGFLEGHRTARPVVVPMRASDRDLETVGSEIDHEDESDIPAVMPMWRRDTMPVRGRSATHDSRDQVVAWVGGRRIPLMAGALCVAMIGVMVANATVGVPAPTEASGQAPGVPSGQGVPPSGPTTGPAGEPLPSPGFGAVVAGRSNLSSADTGTSPVGAAGAAGARSGAQPGSSSQAGLPGADVVDAYLPAPAPAPSPPSPAPPAPPPVVAAPARVLTIAEQTAANALAAANLTAANALAASNLTAANAAAAAAETARVAAAAAETTRLQALADALAVANPVG